MAIQGNPQSVIQDPIFGKVRYKVKLRNGNLVIPVVTGETNMNKSTSEEQKKSANPQLRTQLLGEAMEFHPPPPTQKKHMKTILRFTGHWA